MWTFITQLLVTLVSLGFFLVSCQNVMHIVKGSLCFVLKHIHQELDKELGESEGLSDDEETISTRVVRRRVFLKVTPGKRRVAGRTSGARGQSEGTLWWCMCGDAERIPTQVRRYDKDLRAGRPLWLHSVLGAIAACGTCSELPQYPAADSGGAQLWDLRGVLSFCVESQLQTSRHPPGLRCLWHSPLTSLGGLRKLAQSPSIVATAMIKHTKLLWVLAPACLRAHDPTWCWESVGALVWPGLFEDLIGHGCCRHSLAFPRLLLLLGKSHLPVWVFPLF